jgi:3-hydroxyacyl-CoA dehydrogenase
MGCGIAARSALAGNKTVLVGRDLGRTQHCLDEAFKAVQELADNGLADQKSAAKAGEFLTCSIDLESSLEEARFVIETISENLKQKQDLFARLDKLLPVEIPIASNTSGFRISDIAANMEHPERAVTGLDLCKTIQDTVLPALSDTRKAPEYMRRLVEQGNLGYKTGKGIYDWSEKDMPALQKKRNEFIIHALKKV